MVDFPLFFPQAFLQGSFELGQILQLIFLVKGFGILQSTLLSTQR